MEWREGEYLISNDKALISIDAVCNLLSKSYWAPNRPRHIHEAAIQNSLCYGVYCGTHQIGFARVVTDYSTMFWLGDVIIDEKHRGKGLGKKLIQCVIETKEIKGLLGVLGTSDAHGLYEKYGFVKEPDKFMMKKREENT
ncbi:MAG: GNAT family N-acetyltransferase [Clostridia bacterium]|nr:GNAT family N-acetyltransferase [Clostridia bacterium]